MKVVAIVGMVGAGKSEIAKLFEENGFTKIRFGDVTDKEIRKQGLVRNEESERQIREQLREELGMAAYAKLNIPIIDAARQHADVVIDGLYSWEEYTLLKDYYGDEFYVVAVWASPKTRYARLSTRLERGLSREEASGRDRAEIEKINKGGPIVMADFTISNESSLVDSKRKTERILAKIRNEETDPTRH